MCQLNVRCAVARAVMGTLSSSLSQQTTARHSTYVCVPGCAPTMQPPRAHTIQETNAGTTQTLDWARAKAAMVATLAPVRVHKAECIHFDFPGAQRPSKFHFRRCASLHNVYTYYQR